MFTLSPKEASVEIITCIQAGLTPLLTSSPGVGKSSIVAQIAQDYGLKLIDLRLSQCTPEDLQGYPMRNGNKATFTPFDVFPIAGEPIPEGCNGWLLFLDELTSATKPVQAAAYKLILDRMVGSFHLHENVAIVGAGNKASDKAVVNQMSTALQSRLIHYELEASVPEWVELAQKRAFDHRIVGFIQYMPSRLMDFRPDHHDKTFACPRTWEFLSKLVKGRDVSSAIGARVAGTIGQGVGIEFITFAQEFDRLPKLPEIIKNPFSVPIPHEASTKFATMSMLTEHGTKANLDPIVTYVERFDIEFQVIFGRGIVARHPTLLPNAASSGNFAKFVQNMSRYVN